MSLFINILCKKSVDLTRREIVSGTEEFWYEDAPIVFAPSEVDSEIDDPSWAVLRLTFPGVDRPVAITRFDTGKLISDLISDIRSEIESIPSDVANHLDNVSAVISIEVFPETLNDDLWEFLDLVESFLATKLNGIIATDDGIYDEKLKLIAS
ncbi:hypothetical protein [Nocardia seriolae]|uniref:Uncharacterized protein n=1 Tax=Nocardia seriolae TaxID=37332 RepID=A0A0B8NL22_9NOCA|nr:hypothetical protein [Nocardia seriolae]MTJ66223.1 hypothetical protein [Nocardia seriolae]MTJ74465.1 hypothetical protein [Nocardia seriolae]MTJ85864.1 hypothetical protein [Nocardia seriolae]MTK29858.1 hypothetical protein [Nocardia seriolae]MTK44214.1 hypothetical protein [Nocardia seriolae]